MRGRGKALPGAFDSVRDALIVTAAFLEFLAAAARTERVARRLRRFVDLRRGRAEIDRARIGTGLTGLAGRASGQARDLRCDFPIAPYDTLSVRKAGSTDGDVAARVAVRFAEIDESLRLVGEIVAGLPAGELCVPLGNVPEHRLGLGAIEGWRGPALVALASGPGQSIRRCHPHDPSWQNWPVLEHAIIDNIVPDFPLINKSFNLSYSGHDL